jgi:hypothetical protein
MVEQDRRRRIQKINSRGIILEERFSEATGAVGLMHKAYQSNQVIVRAVSRFIAPGDIPT